MDILFAVHRLLQQAAVIEQLASGVDDTEAHWKPSPGDWSIVEVINHLYDEERDDFRRRFDLTLHEPATPWPPINPPQWAIDRRYNERGLAESLGNFLAERRASLAWLQGLDAVDLASTHTHPHIGSMTAGDVLAAWVAHDCLHIRQLNELHYQYWAQHAQGYRVDYAGDW